ncbi:FAD-binding monooxygenase moxY [Paramyrothecium foliicola]|nr:FAD-binding monooxygenase moxY [Paramyrothecium foliicola]
MEGFVDLAIYDKNSDIGGTWLENRYPGVACDVPAHIYTFPFEPNPDWSSFYAEGPEIWAYMKRTTEKYKLDEHVQFNSRVKSTVWDDAKGKWILEIEQGGSIIRDEADVLINGSGILNKWRWPSIQGLDAFKGTKVHSASWDESLDWTGKKVAVIGNGSSALQILPKMQPKAAKLVNYIRSATWISANYSAELTPEGKNFKYTEEQKEEFRRNPRKLHELRREIEHHFNQFFYTILVDSPQQKAAMVAYRALMEERLNYDPELCSKLIPEWKVGCRRLSPGEGYLEALQKPNVRAEFTPIERITEHGIKTAEGIEEFDIIVCATGFDVSFTPSWNLVGKNGVKLSEQWREDPAAYFGVCAPNMPNYFIFNGPNCPVGHGSFLSVMDWTADYILRWCKKIAVEDIKAVQVNQKATDDYNTYTQEFMKRTAWASGCRSWYKNGKTGGKVTATYAGSVLHYKEILETFRTEDFEYEFNSSNRFNFMGNGLTAREEKGEHLGFYVYK